MNKIQEIDVKNKRILLRTDFNIPIKNNEIESDKRIREAIPTIQYLLEQGAEKITIITHLGKPKGKIDEKYSLWPVANHLAKLLFLDANFNAPAEVFKLSDKIIMLENLRFNPSEEENDPEFAKKLASDQDIFCSDAFGTCHRAHASIVGVTKFLPSYAGFLVQKEVEKLDNLARSKDKPFTVILGGSKISNKLPVLKNLVLKADNFLIGGAIADTFLAARRHYLGESLVEKDAFREANIIWQNIMDEPNRNIFLPTDLIFTEEVNKADNIKTIETKDLLKPEIAKGFSAVDIGPKTIQKYQLVISKSKKIFWNGNMGISEIEKFAEGTKAIASAILNSSAQVVIGGGDTVAAVEALNISAGTKASSNIYLSTGGGATLEFLAGKVLPGLKVLE